MMDFYINGALVEPPIGWDDTSISRRFDFDTQITQLTYDQEYTWTGSVYAGLYNLYRTGNVCDLLEVEVRVRGRMVVRGVIFITDCVFNESIRTVQVKVRDDGFSARIQNNLSVPITMFGDRSKNGDTITPIPTANVFMFTQETGGPLVGTTTRACYRVHDAMRFAVDWMTDGNVSFVSDFFNTGDGAEDYVTSGVNLLSETGTDTLGPTVSFRDLFTTWRILRNVGIGFERVGGQPVVRVEHISYFQENPTTVVQCTNADEVVLDFVQELLYSHVNVGTQVTDNTDCANDCGAFVSVRYFGFKEEGFALSGTCNIDKPLGLAILNKVVIDGNTIQSILVDGDDGFNDNLICVHVDPNTLQATSGDPLNIGQYWYNVPYTNAEVMRRYEDYLSGNINLFNLVPDLNRFLCAGSAPNGIFSPSIDYQSVTVANAPAWTSFPDSGGNVVWFNDNAAISGGIIPRIIDGFTCFDIGNRYDDLTGRYSVEFDGAIRFNWQFSIQAASGTPTGTLNVRTIIERYDIGGTLLNSEIIPAVNDTVFNLTTLQPTAIFDSGFLEANAGDYFVFRFEATTTNPFTTTLTIFNGWVELVETRSVVEQQQTNIGNKKLGVRRTFTYPLDDPATDTLINDTRAHVRVTGAGTNAQGFVSSLGVNPYTNTATISVVTND